MLARIAALVLLACLPCLGAVRAQQPKETPPPGQAAPPPPAAEPANPVIPWVLAVLLPIAVLAVVCMPARKG